ncbi:MAG TPA: PhoPQ-activated protein PqaA family protein [Pirellulales bacterium]|nr:PhoPQ-activated protein PqaA family protein [Pirellulales bacterium]
MVKRTWIALPSLSLAILSLVAPPRLVAEEAVGVKPADGPLKAFVAKEDKSYHWTKRREAKLGKGTVVELTLTSQTWKNIVWKHQLFIYRPSETKHAAEGLLMITGGAWRPDLEKPLAEGAPLDFEERGISQVKRLTDLAEHLQAPVAVLMQVPEQPIFNGLVEDQIISFTFAQYFITNDAEWPLLLPMAKSAVRAMDAVQEFCRKDWSLDVKHFVVTGASKRGWTTWLTAAVDPRVNALAPMVIDTLNFAPQSKHQLETYGTFSEQLKDYSSKGLYAFLGTARGKQLVSIVDPYSYRGTLTQPKFILLGTNDRYWTLDALNLYWDDLQGEKYVCYTPNSGHGLNDPARIAGALNALHFKCSEGAALPKLSFAYRDEKDKTTLRIDSDVKPREVRVWTAASKTRDFRESKWKSQPAAGDGAAYSFDVPQPASGFAALFGEAVYDHDGMPLFLSTKIKIVAAK